MYLYGNIWNLTLYYKLSNSYDRTPPSQRSQMLCISQLVNVPVAHLGLEIYPKQ